MTKVLVCVPLLFMTSSALAHPGTAHSLLHGFAHPFSGLDHLVAMLLVGVWAARRAGVSRLLLPAAFLGGLALGVLAGVAGVPFLAAEPIVAASIVVFAGAILARLRLCASVGLVALFALFHGYVHMAELPQDAAMSALALGMLAGSAALHAVGFAVGLLFASRRPRLQP